MVLEVKMKRLLMSDMIPHTDIYEEKGELVMKAELPGINKEDLDVTLEGDLLTIKTEKKEEEVAVADRTHHIRERYYGSYHRSMRLPYLVNKDQVSASLDNGILELRLLKAEDTEVEKIEVNAQLAEGQVKTRKRVGTSIGNMGLI